MGSSVIIDNTLCYLIATSGDEVLIIPRDKLEPRLRTQIPALSTISTYGVQIQDDRGLEYLGLSPWGDYSLKKYEKYSGLEESVRQLISSNINEVSKSFRKNKKDFSCAESLWIDPKLVRNTEYFNPVRFGARQLVNFLEAFAWVSKKYTVECFPVGEARDFDFKIYEKSSLSILGKLGKLHHHFRWSEFEFLEVNDMIEFSIKTVDGYWGAAMGRSGWRRR